MKVKSSNFGLPLFSIFILLLINGSAGLSNVRILLPNFVVVGQDSTVISCKYDLDYGESLYALKLYKGSQEFYRFLPKEVPSIKTFPLAGVNVDVLSSNSANITLRNISLESGGQYKCVVSIEYSFETLSSNGSLIVVVIGDESRPVLQLDSKRFHPGDRVTSRCYGPPSYPPANIIFYLNDRKMDTEMQKTEIRDNPVNPHTKITVSTLSFDLPGSLAPLKIRCRATVFSVYDQYSFFTIHPSARTLSGPDTLLRTSSSASSSSLGSTVLCSFLATLAIILIVQRSY